MEIFQDFRADRRLSCHFLFVLSFVLHFFHFLVFQLFDFSEKKVTEKQIKTAKIPG